ncbi:MAG: Dabb family protein [Bacteroidota bacterium]
MRKNNWMLLNFVAVVIAIAITSCSSGSAGSAEAEMDTTSEENTVSEKKTVLRHVVAFQFKDEISVERREQAVKDFLDLKDRIPEILSFEGGEDVSVEGFAKEFTHCFIITFADEAARDIYIPHPAHIELAEKNKPLMKDLLVIDVPGEM